MKRTVLVWLVAMTAGRAMTLAFITRAGGSELGDPPEEWLMPLLGDGFVGLSAVVVAILLWRNSSPAAWTIAIAWSAIGAFDAIAAFFVQRTSPWPEFFMLRAFGSSMFFAAAFLHLAIIALLFSPDVRREFWGDRQSLVAGKI